MTQKCVLRYMSWIKPGQYSYIRTIHSGGQTTTSLDEAYDFSSPEVAKSTATMYKWEGWRPYMSEPETVMEV